MASRCASSCLQMQTSSIQRTSKRLLIHLYRSLCPDFDGRRKMRKLWTPCPMDLVGTTPRRSIGLTQRCSTATYHGRSHRGAAFCLEAHGRNTWRAGYRGRRIAPSHRVAPPLRVLSRSPPGVRLDAGAPCAARHCADKRWLGAVVFAWDWPVRRRPLEMSWPSTSANSMARVERGNAVSRCGACGRRKGVPSAAG